MRWNALFLVLLLGLLIFLAFNRHSKDRFNDYHSVLWADASGYHVYLPLVLGEMPDSGLNELQASAGMGFHYEAGRVITKYPYGTALLQAPFYLIFKCLFPDDVAFAPSRHRSVILAGAVYLWLGLLLLFLTLKGFVPWLRWLALLALLTGTNLYYYGVDSGGMSHVYSFFLFSLLIFLLHRDTYSALSIWAIAAVSALIIIARPINGLPLIVLLIMHLRVISSAFLGLSKASSRLLAFLLLLTVAAILTPQLMYWKYAYGSYFAYSYGEESFTNLLSPQVTAVLFSTNNGLLLYSPLWLVLVSACVFVLLRPGTKTWGWAGLSLFLLITYLFASWWNWHFGCAFSHRCYVEFLPVMVIPFAMMLRHLSRNRLGLVLTSLVLILFMSYSMKLTYTFDECWLGDHWDYARFSREMIFGKPR